MSNLKNEVKERILNNATNEFYEQGFNGASMRKIARNSRMVVGNVYRYFNSKENLFNEVLNEAYEAIVRIIAIEILDINHLDPVLNELTSICITYPKQIVILITRYIDAEDDLLLNNLKSLISLRLKEDLKDIDDDQIDLIFHLLLNGILYILQNYETNEIENQLKAFFTFIFYNIEQRLRMDK